MTAHHAPRTEVIFYTEDNAFPDKMKRALDSALGISNYKTHIIKGDERWGGDTQHALFVVDPSNDWEHTKGVPFHQQMRDAGFASVLVERELTPAAIKRALNVQKPSRISPTDIRERQLAAQEAGSRQPE